MMNGVLIFDFLNASNNVYPALGSDGRPISEIIALNLCNRSFSSASSVDLLIVNLIPNASNDFRSKMLFSGLSSTHSTDASLNRYLAEYDVTESLTKLAISRTLSSLCDSRWHSN